MLHGKKGFDRIVYAFKNVLSTPVTWLFCDLGATGMGFLSDATKSPYMLTDRQALAPDPLDIHFPTKVAVAPDITSEIKVNMPSLKPPTDTSSEYGDDFKDFAVETHEWLSLISLNSPRVNPDDQIDSFLSRYVPPGESTTRSNLVKITWRGFLSPSWAHKLFVHALLNVPQEVWFVYYVGGFGGVRVEGSKDCTILKVPDAPNEYLLWEVA
jgi:ribonuclease P/MRP protein subunit RPP40